MSPLPNKLPEHTHSYLKNSYMTTFWSDHEDGKHRHHIEKHVDTSDNMSIVIVEAYGHSHESTPQGILVDNGVFVNPDDHFVPGDIFITRNANEEDNMSPGYWNHAAIYGGNSEVIEAQILPGKVIVSGLDDFWNRYPTIIVLRDVDASVRDNAAKYARQSINSSYRKIASVFKRLRKSTRGENCVSVVRRAYKKASSIDYKWRIPDDLVKMQSGATDFVQILQKNLVVTIHYN